MIPNLRHASQHREPSRGIFTLGIVRAGKEWLPYELMDDHDLSIYLRREGVGLGQDLILGVVLDISYVDGLGVERLRLVVRDVLQSRDRRVRSIALKGIKM